MKTLADFIKRRPLLAFFILAYAFAWIFYPLIAISPVLGIPALFAPAAAAIIVSWATGGLSQVRRLLKKITIWRVHFIWYFVALGLPVMLSFLINLLASFFVGGISLELAPITPLGLIVFVLVVGEELGWRGYAQLELEKSFSPLLSAVILGVLWGLWHLPGFFLPGLPQNDIPLLAFVLWTIALSVIAAWLMKFTRASVLITTLFHGATNTFGFLAPDLDIAVYRWLMAIVYCSAALLIVAIFGSRLVRSRPTIYRDPSLPTSVPPGP
jgi:membrane protease YdiL (CAAX protease family)